MVTTKPEFDFVFRIKKERYLVMSYLNNQLGYRDALLDTRSIIKKGDYIVLDPDGLVKNVVPGYENCDVTILGSPAMGATFADYLVHVHEGGKNTGIGGEGIESFLYVVDGELSVKNDDQSAELTKGGYIYSPASNNITFEAKGEATLYVYNKNGVDNSKKDDETTTPAKQDETTTPAKQDETTTPAKQNETTTPAKQNETTTVAPTTKAISTTAAPATVKKTTVKKTTVKATAKKLSSNKVKLSVKKVAGASKYAVQISTTKNFKKVVAKKTSKKAVFTVKSKKLKGKKKLYVRVKVYKKVNGKTVASQWSKATKIRLKK